MLMLFTKTYNVRVFTAAFLAAFLFFISFSTAAAATLFGPVGSTVDNSAEYNSGQINAHGYTNLVLGFDYDAEALDNGDGFTYGWRTGGGDNDLNTFNAVDEGGPVGDETGVVSVGLPAGAEMANLEVYVAVSANASGASDFLEVTNLTVTGDVDPCELSVAGPTDIQNSVTGEYFDTLQDAIDDCDTQDGDTVEMFGDLSTLSQVTINKDITLNGNGFTLSPTFAKTDNDNNSAIGVIATDNVIVENLVIDGTLGTNLHGLNVYVSSGVQFIDVSSNNNDRSGLVVNGSKVVVNNFSTIGNGWHAINVGKGGGVTDQPILTVDGVSQHGEVSPIPTPHIFIDDLAQSVVINDTNNQYIHQDFDLGGGVIARAYTLVPDIDADDDGVEDVDDKCEGTTDDNFSDWGRAKGRYAVIDGEWMSSGKGDKKFDPDMEYTYGCSGTQILYIMSEKTDEDFGGHYKHGLSKSVLEAWHDGHYNLGPAVLETVVVPGNSALSTLSTMNLNDGEDYVLNAYGTYRFANWGEYGIADAEWAYRDAAHAPGGIAGWVQGEGYYVSECGLDVQVDGDCVDWGGLSLTNEYSLPYVGTGAPVGFSIYDSAYGDNSGSVMVDIVGDLIIDLW